MSMAADTGRIPQFTRGDRLRKARETTGMTTRQFAEAIGVSQKTVSDAENDKRQTRRIMMNAWSLVTQVPLVWLETGEVPGPDIGPGKKLPRLDSNQQPSGYRFAQHTRGLSSAVAA